MESESTPAAATDFSYSSILKRSKQAAVKATLEVPAVEQKSAARTETKTKQSSGGAAKTKAEEEKKKVTTKTPIEFNLLSALTVRKGKDKKAAVRVTASKKAEAERNAVRNALDSSAPLRKRGKEREGGKKKRKTVLKKTILAERARNKELREAAEKRQVISNFSYFLSLSVAEANII